MAGIPTQTDVRENLQEVGDRIKNAMNNITVPVRLYQGHSTAERRSGYYIEYFSLEKFMEYVMRYYTMKGMGNTEPYQHLSALLQTVVGVREQLANDLERTYLLWEQMQLLHERELDQLRAKLKKPVVEEPQPVVEEIQLGVELPQPVAKTTVVAGRTMTPELKAIGAELRKVREETVALNIELPSPTGTVPLELPELEPPSPKEKRGMSEPDDENDDGMADGLIEDELEERSGED